MFLLLAIVALGGTLTAWGISQLHLTSTSTEQSIRRFIAYILSFIVGLIVVSGFLLVSFLNPPETTDAFVAWASHILLILSFVSLSLLLYAIWHADSLEQGIASIFAGILLVGLASFPLFHPAFIYPIFRSVFIITPSELLICVLFFIVGMSFVLGQRFWAAVRVFFATYLPEHPFYTGIVASMLLVTIVILATMPPFLTSWVNRMQGFKTPILEAQFSSARDSHNRPPSFWGQSNNFPNELLLEEEIDQMMTSLSQIEGVAHGKTSDLTDSMQRFDLHLRKIGFYDDFKLLGDFSNRPHITEVRRRAGCWAMKLYYGKDHCETVEKQPSAQLSPRRNELAEMVYTKNPLFYATVAFLFQFSEDFKKAEFVLEAGLKDANMTGVHWTAAKAYLTFWLGYLMYNRYHELQIEEADNRALDLFRQAIGHATFVLEELSVNAKVMPAMRHNEDLWKIFSLQAKSSYILVAADSLLNEWSARRYAKDIMDALDTHSYYQDYYPLLIESVGWAKIRFHKDQQELREGKAILVELERKVAGDSTDKSLKWKVLKTIRNHISEAELLLESG